MNDRIARHEGRRTIRRVLIMESIPVRESLLLHHFERLGCRVEHVASAAAVVASVRDLVPDLVVVDRQELPDMPTAELLDRVHREAPDCRVVVATGLNFTDVERGEPLVFEEGAADVIDKPYTRHAVQQVIDNVEPGGDRPPG
ncbi:hypothetical protein GCM10010123_42680 [Pilimelia anulata]|uniref:Response regulatory domain-containing protein n=1 Tax=Pilimelia anulata TaxID=53371 RepID=A0A8J3BAZ7_9ACTN|nr:response regulator [Pilimelia anulata]GGK08198.1 hypothetical protein GCM10010123_42680 [Pilimelia anulata]